MSIGKAFTSQRLVVQSALEIIVASLLLIMEDERE